MRLHNFATCNNYKYNGKELQETGMYDYGARHYMGDVGRWISPDPLSEEFSDWSPYNYALNNPIRFVDPDGMAPEEGPGPGKPWGKISVVTNVPGTASMTSGHGWIVLTRQDGYQMTTSLWGNTGKQEFWVGKEKNSSNEIVTSRTLPITEEQAQKIIDFNQSDSNTDWNAVNTCAAYSANLWNSVTGKI